jgi:hypothetical protein
MCGEQTVITPTHGTFMMTCPRGCEVARAMDNNTKEIKNDRSQYKNTIVSSSNNLLGL